MCAFPRTKIHGILVYQARSIDYWCTCHLLKPGNRFNGIAGTFVFHCLSSVLLLFYHPPLSFCHLLSFFISFCGLVSFDPPFAIVNSYVAANAVQYRGEQYNVGKYLDTFPYG